MNILILTPDYPPVYGGIGTHVFFLAQNLVEKGNDVTVIINRILVNEESANEVIYKKDKSITIIDIPNEQKMIEIKNFEIDNYDKIEMEVSDVFGNSAQNILKFLPHKNYDIIHMHDAYVSMYGKILSQCLDIPLVTTFHSMHANKTSIKYYMREYAANNSEIIISVSEFIREKIVKSYGTNKEKVTVIYNSINAQEKFLKSNVKKSNEITFCGRFETIKGIIPFIYEFSNMLECINENNKKNDIRLNLIGDGSLKNQIVKLLEKLKIKKHVSIYNNIKNEKVLEIFSRSCCVVIPSLEEPFATVGLEAMSVKTAVIASNVGGMPEMIEHGYNGYIYDINEKELLKQYMLELLFSPRKAIEFGNNGYKILNEKFTWQVNIYKIIKLYKEAIERHRNST